MQLYLHHFGLQQMPFALTPNTSFYAQLPAHAEALNVLNLGLQSGEGFLKITGEVGTGKTLLCRLLLQQLDQQGIISAYIPNPHLTPAQLSQAFADEIGCPAQPSDSLAQLQQQINQRLLQLAQEDKKVVLLVDEAQGMPEETLEALRLLTNLETETEKLLQVVLFGQPELDLLLRQSHLRQLSQRITFSYDISSLSAKEVAQYIQHRLITAGYGTQPLFSAAALRLITQASGGIPRLINILANKALLVAFGKGQHRIKPQHIRAAIRDSRHAIYIPAPATAQPGWLLLALGLGAVASASLLGLS